MGISTSGREETEGRPPLKPLREETRTTTPEGGRKQSLILGGEEDEEEEGEVTHTNKRGREKKKNL